MPLAGPEGEMQREMKMRGRLFEEGGFVGGGPDRIVAVGAVEAARTLQRIGEDQAAPLRP